MIEGTTSSGFVFRIEEDARDDMELLEAFMAIDAGNISGVKAAIERLLGTEQKNALYEHHRNKETGRVSAKAVLESLTEILHESGQQSTDIKN